MPESTSTPTWRVLRTVCIFFIYMSMGAHTILGATIPDLEVLFNTDTKTLGLTYMGIRAGFLIGVLISASLADRLNQDLFMGVVGSVGAIALAVSPWTGTVVYFSIAYGIAGIANGLCIAVAESYIIGLWLGRKLQEPLTQMVHFGWSLAATLCPLVVQPFLSERLGGPAAKPSDTSNISSDGFVYKIHTYVHHNDTEVFQNTSDTITPRGDETNVGVGYLLIAVFIMLASLFPLLIFCISGPTWKSLPFLKKPITSRSEKIAPKGPSVWLTCGITLILGLYAGEELTYGSLITTFVVKGLDWKSRKRTLITMAYFGALGVGQLTAVSLSFVCRPRVIIIVCLLIINSALLALCFTVHTHEASVWICTIVKSLCNGPMLASIFLWTSKNIFVSGFISSVLYIGNTLGAMGAPPLTAYMMQTYGHIYFLYMCLSLSISTFILFLLLQLFVWIYRKSSHDLSEDRNMELEEKNTIDSMLSTNEKNSVLSSAKNNSPVIRYR